MLRGISDLNRTISHNDLSPQIRYQCHNWYLRISKLEQNATNTNGSVTGSKMADGAVTASKLQEKTIGKDQMKRFYSKVSEA